MNNIQKRRLYYVIFFLLGLLIAATFILMALKQNINAFMTPTELLSQPTGTTYQFHLGGLVKKNSVQHDKGLGVQFVVTDLHHDITVHYVGVLPDLFRENKGVIAQGYLNAQHIFIAQQILAKHDENYMPAAVYRQLQKEKT